MPPIRHRSWLPGSGANRIPRSARYAFNSARRMPGSTRTNRRSGSKSRMRLNRVVSRTTPGPIAAPDSDVPDSRVVIGTSSTRHSCRTARTSSSASANATARGWTAHGLASVEWVRRIESSVRTFSAPIACSKARRRVASSAEPVIRTAHQRRGLTCPFRTGVSPAAGTTFMSRTAFDGSGAHQSGSPAEDDGPWADGVPGPRVPHIVGPWVGDRQPDLPAVQGPSDADLRDDATAPREGARPDPTRDTAPVQGRAVRDLPACPGGRHALPGEADRRGIGHPRARVRDQRSEGAGVARTVRGDLRPQERPRAAAEDVRRRDAGGDRHRDDEEPGTNPRGIHAGPRRQSEAGGPLEVRFLLYAGEPRRCTRPPETRRGAPHRLHDARLHARLRRQRVPDEPPDPG